MSLTTKELGKTVVKGSELGTIVSDCLISIDNELMSAEKKWGRNVVTVELPRTFVGVPSVSLQNLQRYVYSRIIQSLVSRGFDPRLQYDGPRKTFLHIAWTVDISEEEVAAMNSVILQRKIQTKEDLQAFRDGTDEKSKKFAAALKSPTKKKIKPADAQPSWAKDK